MTVRPLLPDEALVSAPSATAKGAFAAIVDALGATLQKGSQAEDAFAAGRGSLRDAVYARAKADVAVEVASAELQHAAQALQSILTMQV
ncbi:MAG: flagellar hook-basal body complex protein FliE [Candidatus Baltobacteraceae bacterium]